MPDKALTKEALRRSKKHFQKPLVKLGEIGPAFTAVEFYFPKDLGIIRFLAETAVVVLDVTRGKHHIIRYLQKLSVIAAFRTDNTHLALYIDHGLSCAFNQMHLE